MPINLYELENNLKQQLMSFPNIEFLFEIDHISNLINEKEVEELKKNENVLNYKYILFFLLVEIGQHDYKNKFWEYVHKYTTFQKNEEWYYSIIHDVLSEIKKYSKNFRELIYRNNTRYVETLLLHGGIPKNYLKELIEEIFYKNYPLELLKKQILNGEKKDVPRPIKNIFEFCGDKSICYFNQISKLYKYIIENRKLNKSLYEIVNELQCNNLPTYFISEIYEIINGKHKKDVPSRVNKLPFLSFNLTFLKLQIVIPKQENLIFRIAKIYIIYEKHQKILEDIPHGIDKITQKYYTYQDLIIFPEDYFDSFMLESGIKLQIEYCNSNVPEVYELLFPEPCFFDLNGYQKRKEELDLQKAYYMLTKVDFDTIKSDTNITISHIIEKKIYNIFKIWLNIDKFFRRQTSFINNQFFDKEQIPIFTPISFYQDALDGVDIDNYDSIKINDTPSGIAVKECISISNLLDNKLDKFGLHKCEIISSNSVQLNIRLQFWYIPTIEFANIDKIFNSGEIIKPELIFSRSDFNYVRDESIGECFIINCGFTDYLHVPKYVLIRQNINYIGIYNCIKTDKINWDDLFEYLKEENNDRKIVIYTNFNKELIDKANISLVLKNDDDKIILETNYFTDKNKIFDLSRDDLFFSPEKDSSGVIPYNVVDFIVGKKIFIHFKKIFLQLTIYSETECIYKKNLIEIFEPTINPKISGASLTNTNGESVISNISSNKNPLIKYETTKAHIIDIDPEFISIKIFTDNILLKYIDLNGENNNLLICNLIDPKVYGKYNLIFSSNIPIREKTLSFWYLPDISIGFDKDLYFNNDDILITIKVHNNIIDYKLEQFENFIKLLFYDGQCSFYFPINKINCFLQNENQEIVHEIFNNMDIYKCIPVIKHVDEKIIIGYRLLLKYNNERTLIISSQDYRSNGIKPVLDRDAFYVDFRKDNIIKIFNFLEKITFNVSLVVEFIEPDYISQKQYELISIIQSLKEPQLLTEDSNTIMIIENCYYISEINTCYILNIGKLSSIQIFSEKEGMIISRLITLEELLANKIELFELIKLNSFGYYTINLIGENLLKEIPLWYIPELFSIKELYLPIEKDVDIVNSVYSSLTNKNSSEAIYKIDILDNKLTININIIESIYQLHFALNRIFIEDTLLQEVSLDSFLKEESHQFCLWHTLQNKIKILFYIDQSPYRSDIFEIEPIEKKKINIDQVLFYFQERQQKIRSMINLFSGRIQIKSKLLEPYIGEFNILTIFLPKDDPFFYFHDYDCQVKFDENIIISFDPHLVSISNLTNELKITVMNELNGKQIYNNKIHQSTFRMSKFIQPQHFGFYRIFIHGNIFGKIYKKILTFYYFPVIQKDEGINSVISLLEEKIRFMITNFDSEEKHKINFILELICLLFSPKIESNYNKSIGDYQIKSMKKYILNNFYSTQTTSSEGLKNNLLKFIEFTFELIIRN